jgi:hypothetical protein
MPVLRYECRGQLSIHTFSRRSERTSENRLPNTGQIQLFLEITSSYNAHEFGHIFKSSVAAIILLSESTYMIEIQQITMLQDFTSESIHENVITTLVIK